jgi:iron-sulfur cluster assembly protein
MPCIDILHLSFYILTLTICRFAVKNQIKLDKYRKDFVFLQQNKFSVMTAAQLAPVQLTNTTVRELNRIREEQKIPNNYGLRIGVKGGGCSGFSYVIGFDETKEGDDTFEVNGLTVLMQKAHAIYLLGMEIDWVEGLNNRGFSFNNPNAKETCGCGTSFSA